MTKVDNLININPISIRTFADMFSFFASNFYISGPPGAILQMARPEVPWVDEGWGMYIVMSIHIPIYTVVKQFQVIIIIVVVLVVF